jgi:hypothetical protein
MPKKRAAQHAPKRRFPRIPAETSILLRKLGGPVHGVLSTTKVMGLGGCCFVHKEPQGVGSTLFLSILVGQELAEAKVRVVYERPRDDGSFEIGVEFEEVPPGDLLLLEGLVAFGKGDGSKA